MHARINVIITDLQCPPIECFLHLADLRCGTVPPSEAAPGICVAYQQHHVFRIFGMWRDRLCKRRVMK
jgi:hypothetical protein